LQPKHTNPALTCINRTNETTHQRTAGGSDSRETAVLAARVIVPATGPL